jgi:hypothetical protein
MITIYRRTNKIIITENNDKDRKLTYHLESIETAKTVKKQLMDIKDSKYLTVENIWIHYINMNGGNY